MKQRSENQTRLLDIFKCIIKFEVAMLRVNLGGGALTAHKIRWGAPGDHPACPCIKPPLRELYVKFYMIE